MAFLLSYNASRDFSRRTSILGFLMIFAALATAIFITVFTKGRVPATEIIFLDDINASGYRCNSTVVYPGQTFGGLPHDSTFIYTSGNSFTYSQETLSNCAVQPNSSTLDIIGPPLAWPRFAWNITVQCNVSGPLTATFAISQLDHSGPSETTGVGLWNETVGLLGGLNQNTTCNGEKIYAFRIIEYKDYVLYPTQNSLYICVLALSQMPDMQQYMQSVKDTALQDFNSIGGGGGGMSQLQDVLYPCTQDIKVWAPAWTILWDCYTTAAATISPAIVIVIWILKKLTGVADSAQLRESRLNNATSPGKLNDVTSDYLPLNKFERREN